MRLGSQKRLNELMLRSEKLFWEGSSVKDPQFLLRRDKMCPENFTCFSFGDLVDQDVSALLSGFIPAFPKWRVV